MAGTPTKERHVGPFLAHLEEGMPRGLDIAAEEAARAVFGVICDQIDQGEVIKVLNLMPRELRDLWPLLAQVEAVRKS